MKIIKEYKIVKGYENQEESFIREINSLIDKGFQPLGTTKIRSRITEKRVKESVFYQVMVLVENK